VSWEWCEGGGGGGGPTFTDCVTDDNSLGGHFGPCMGRLLDGNLFLMGIFGLFGVYCPEFYGWGFLFQDLYAHLSSAGYAVKKSGTSEWAGQEISHFAREFSYLI
jgi:hypothetical protein